MPDSEFDLLSVALRVHKLMVRFNLLWHERPVKQAIMAAELIQALA
ncbi:MULTISPECIES: hypothetical protein [Burkholderiaceae]|nr:MULTISPECIES: hypothetical protein [Burkholderiaceae]MCF2135374.1 hypothetical protein [Mycetohabitans sp. B3]MCG1039782.1 hypothetical protein [Mycetohabitans sp. B7]SIT65490.1 hypothetical protein SAMN04487769_0868 [Burkholderia sp. b14]